MNISIYMLADWFRNDGVITDIKKGAIQINRIRIASPRENINRNPEILYLIPCLEEERNGVKCLSGDDQIFVPSVCPEEVYNAVYELFDLYRSIDFRAEMSIRQVEELQNLVEILGAGLWHNLFVVDNMQRVIASADHFEFAEENSGDVAFLREHRYLPMATMEKMLKNWDMDEYKRGTQHFHHPSLPRGGVYRNLFLGEKNIGYIMCPEEVSELSTGEIQYMEIAADYVERWFAASDNPPILSVSNVYNEILDGKVEGKDIPVILKNIAWEETKEKIFVCVKPIYGNHYGLNFSFRWVKNMYWRMNPFIYDEMVCMIFPYRHEDKTAFVSELKRLAGQLNAYIGISYEFSDLTCLRQYYEQAKMAVDNGGHEAGEIYFCQDMKTEYIRRIIKEHVAFDLASGELQILRQYDREHGTELYLTLYYYLFYERNQAKTVERLYIHRNTLMQRIRRIADLIDVDLDDSRSRFGLLLSYFVLEGIQ